MFEIMIAHDLKLVCIMYILCVCTIHCYNIEVVKTLLRNKTADYDRNLRPTSNQSAPTVVYAAMEVISIQEFDEVQEKLTITAFLAMYWTDEFMIWNVSEYDGILDVILGSDQFWTPNLDLVNNANKLQRLGDSWQPIRFTHEGDASFFPGVVFSATCRTDVTLYPLDSHWCGFTFTPWAHSSSEIYLHPLIDKVQKQFFSENGAWQFLDSNVARTGNADISFYIRLGRRPLFVLVNIIMPVIFMTFLNAMVFCIPAKSGERMSYSITVLLAIAVFLTIVGENMPKTSTPMSIFSYYLLVILIISACITLTTIFVLHVFHFEKTEPVTGWWLKIAKLPSCRKNMKGKRYKRNKNGTITTTDERPPTSSTYFHSSTSVYDVGSLSRNEVVNVSTTYNDNVYLQCLQRQNECKENESSIEDLTDSQDKSGEYTLSDAELSWKDVSVVLDKLFFTFYFLILIAVTVGLFVSINAKNEEE